MSFLEPIWMAFMLMQHSPFVIFKNQRSHKIWHSFPAPFRSVLFPKIYASPSLGNPATRRIPSPWRALIKTVIPANWHGKNVKKKLLKVAINDLNLNLKSIIVLKWKTDGFYCPLDLPSKIMLFLFFYWYSYGIWRQRPLRDIFQRHPHSESTSYPIPMALRHRWMPYILFNPFVFRLFHAPFRGVIGIGFYEWNTSKAPLPWVGKHFITNRGTTVQSAFLVTLLTLFKASCCAS